MIKIRIGKAMAAMIKIVSILTAPRSSACIRLQMLHSDIVGASSVVFGTGVVLAGSLAGSLADCEFTVWFAFDSVIEKATK